MVLGSKVSARILHHLDNTSLEELSTHYHWWHFDKVVLEYATFDPYPARRTLLSDLGRTGEPYLET